MVHKHLGPKERALNLQRSVVEHSNEILQSLGELAIALPDDEGWAVSHSYSSRSRQIVARSAVERVMRRRQPTDYDVTTIIEPTNFTTTYLRVDTQK